MDGLNRVETSTLRGSKICGDQFLPGEEAVLEVVRLSFTPFTRNRSDSNFSSRRIPPMPEPREHMRHRNWIETILRYIPGFRGYLEKEYRRESDRLLRTWMGDRIRQCKRVTDRLARDLLEARRITILPQIDRVRGRLDTLLGRIEGAVAGYSGFFDYVRVDERLLDRVYEHDLALMQQIETLIQKIESWQPANLGAEQISTVLDDIEILERRWDARTHILEGID